MLSTLFRRNGGSEATQMKKADTPTDNGVGGEWQDYLLVYSDPEMESDEDGSEVITTPVQGKVLRRQDEWDTSMSESGSEEEVESTDTETIWSQEDDQQQQGCHRSRDEVVRRFHVELHEAFVYFQVNASLIPQEEVVDWLCQYFDLLSLKLYMRSDVYYVRADRRWASTRSDSDWVEYVVELLTSIC
ncbi:hypothetical protein V3481_007210 [Fusarium oxysporum f. sp. vasinfectum]